MNVPKDPYMLLSFINTKLRDDFDSLDSFCENYQLDRKDIEEKLNNVGYKYVSNENQFKS